MILWIIIGCLVGIVTIFLIVMSIKDRKVEKKRKIEFLKLEKEKSESKYNVAFFISELIKENDKMLKKFKPSIGEIKMGDIKKISKERILYFKKTKEYKLANSSNESKNKKIVHILEKLLNENSNNWNKKFSEDINFIKKQIKKLDNDFKLKYIPKVTFYMKEGLKNEFSK